MCTPVSPQYNVHNNNNNNNNNMLAVQLAFCSTGPFYRDGRLQQQQHTQQQQQTNNPSPVGYTNRVGDVRPVFSAQFVKFFSGLFHFSSVHI